MIHFMANRNLRIKKIRESREDRVRTVAGKTKSSKVRSQGRTAKALAKSSKTKTIYRAKR
jgi:hypothetical protein